MNKKVIVIGAGVAGLTSAIRLQKDGYQVEIYEKNSIPGGKMHQLQFDGHTFDVGPTIVMMPEIYKDVFRYAGKNPDDYIQMTQLEPMYDVRYKGNPDRHYHLSSNLVKLMEVVESRGITNAEGFLAYLSEMYKRYQVAVKHFIMRPFRSWKDIYNLKMVGQILKLKTFDTADHMMAKFIKDYDLQHMFSFQTLYIGVSPKKGPSLYNIIPLIEILYGVHFIKGGMHAMAKAMERLFLELGGRIHYNQAVSEIIIENKRAKGIRVNDQVILSDYVVCNADFPYAITELVKDEKARGKYQLKKIEKMDYSCSCLVFYWGVEGVYEDLAAHTFIISEDLDDNLDAIFDGRILKDPSCYLHVPSNVDKDLAPAGKSSFYLLIPVSDLGISTYEWNEETVNYYREKAIASIKRLPGLGNIEKKIKTEKYFTPVDYKNTFNAFNGATFGLQPTLKQSNHWRPQAKSKTTEGLYFNGSSTHPGAGVPIVIQSGIICAEELRRDEPQDSFK